MNDILIKGVEMPTSCYKCPCNKDDGFGFFTCGVTKSECNFISLPSDCPLVPVPPHGRLIDADALNSSNTDYLGNHLVYLVDIDDAPTIIPAEEGET